MWARGKLLSGTPAMTSHHVTMKAPVWRKNSSSTSCWNISSFDCRFGWERLSFSAGALSAKRQEMCYQVPVLATLCGLGSILCLKYSARGIQVLVQSWKAQLGIICGQEQITMNYSLASGFEGTPAITSHHVTMKAPVWRKNFSSTSCWNISSLDCRFGWERLSFSAGTLSARQEMCYQVPVLATLWGWGSILCLKYSARGTQVLVQSWKAQLATIGGTCEQRMCQHDMNSGREAIITLNYSLASGFEGTPAITSHHVTMKAPVWRKNSSSTSCWNISSLDCRFGWERLSFSAGTLSARQEMCYQVPVLATLCGWGSILCLKYSARGTQVLVQSWKAQLGIICGQEANHYKLQFDFGIDHLPPCNNEGTSLEKE